jgi:hypothetical protein
MMAVVLRKTAECAGRSVRFALVMRVQPSPLNRRLVSILPAKSAFGQNSSVELSYRLRMGSAQFGQTPCNRSSSLPTEASALASSICTDFSIPELFFAVPTNNGAVQHRRTLAGACRHDAAGLTVNRPPFVQSNGGPGALNGHFIRGSDGSAA